MCVAVVARVRKALRLGGVRLAALLPLVACAAPMTQQGSVSRLDVQKEQFKQQELVIENTWASQLRLDKVARPLLVAALPLCGQHVAARSGISFANAAAYDKDWQVAARMAGLGDTLSIIGVIPGSSAERAGVKVGDRIVALSGDPVPVGGNAMRALNERFAKSFTARLVRKEDRATTSNGVAYTFPQTELPLTVRRDTALVSMAVPMDTVCGYQPIVQRADEVNAFADGEHVFVTTAMLRFATDDELAVVVAHEIGHNAMKHMDARKKNALVGGLFGALLDVAAAAGGVNTGGRYTNEMAALGAQTFSQDFEREADYVGMYILARASQDYSKAANLWRHMATESPGSIKFASSHPTTAERFVRLDQTAAELDAKRKAGADLMPEMKPGH